MSRIGAILIHIFKSSLPCLTAVAMLSLWVGAWGQIGTGTRDGGYRFDFETDVDRDGLPDYWKQTSGRTDVLNPSGKLVGDAPQSGKLCFEMTPTGSTTEYQTVDAFALDGRFTYRLSGWVRTRDLDEGGRKTTLRIETELFDEADKPTGRIASEDVGGTSDGWRQVEVEIPPMEGGASRQVRIGLVMEGTGLSGKGWFDELRLNTQPTIDIGLARTARVLRAGDEMGCEVALGTLVEDEYQLKVTVAGPEGSKALDRTVTVKPDARRRGSVKVDLPMGMFGLYRMQCRLTSGGKEAAREEMQFGYVPGGKNGLRTRGRFGVRMDGAGAEAEAEASALGRLGVGRALVEVWSRGQTTGESREAAGKLDGVLARLRAESVEPTVVLGGVPQDIGLKMLERGIAADGAGITLGRMFSSDEKLWMKPLRAVAERFGGRTGCWLVGVRPRELTRPEEAGRIREVFETRLTGLAPRWKIGVPVGSGQDKEMTHAAQGMDFVLYEPGVGASAEEAGREAASMRTGGTEPWLSVELLDEAKAGRDAQITDMVERATSGLAAGAGVIIVGPAGGLFDGEGNPREAVLALGTLSRELEGKEYVGDLSAQAEVHVAVFSGGGRTTAVFWCEQGRGTWSGPLGRGAKRVDMWGNESAATDGNGQATLRGGKLPVLIRGIDNTRITIQRPARGGAGK